ncbi:MAG: xanthine dehydrogenase family protein subunit M [Deltaproteobacteria bacterium]|nr:xanthine dehydrogenase family protein subunit M [Deltaproteobacteria bacterium]
MIPTAFDHIAPRTIDEALRALAQHGDDAKLLAGGHSLLPLMKLRLANPTLLIDIGKIAELRGIRQKKDKIVIGALTTHYQIESSALLKKTSPLLCETARAIGDVQVRNRGTIGGSLVHADPAADWPAAMLALGAEFNLVEANVERIVHADDFFIGPMTSATAPTEILSEIRIPLPQRRTGSVYLKMPQQASGFAIVGVAAWVRVNGKGSCEDIGIGVTGLADRPFRAAAVADLLRGKKLTDKLIVSAAATIADALEPLEDLHASADYRAHLAKVYAARAVQEAARRAAKSR